MGRKLAFAAMAALVLMTVLPVHRSDAATTMPYYEETSGSGSVENKTYANDSITQSQTSTADIAPVVPDTAAGASGVGMSGVFSKNYTQIDIPLSYALTDDIKIKLNVPYIDRSQELFGTKYSASGLGDISVTGQYIYGQKEMLFLSGLTIKLPTGDKDKTDNGVSMPLGSGSYDFVINQAVAKTIDRFRLLGNVSYRYNTEGEQNGVDYRAGDVFTWLAGVEHGYMAGKLWGYAHASGLVAWESEYSGNGAGDDFKTLDITIGGKYMHTEKLGVQAGVRFPVWDHFGTSGSDPSRNTAFVFSLAGLF